MEFLFNPSDMKKICLITLCTVFFFYETSHAQKLNLEKITDSTAVWSRGRVLLSNGNEIRGMLKYNRMTGLLMFENAVESKALTAAGVLSFQYFDSLQQRQRKFISYGFEDITQRMDSVAKAKGVEPFKIEPKIFEVIMEFKDFAVLYSLGPISVSMQSGSLGAISPRVGGWNGMAARQPSTTYMQMEMLYVFDSKGHVSPLWFSMNREIDRWILDASNSMTFYKTADKIIQRYTEPHYEKINAYALENKLDYKKKEDILKSFEYYKTLLVN